MEITDIADIKGRDRDGKQFSVILACFNVCWCAAGVAHLAVHRMLLLTEPFTVFLFSTATYCLLTQDMLDEAMRVGLPEAAAIFEAPQEEGESLLDEGASASSKAQRGRAEGAILGSVRHSLAQRREAAIG